MSVFRVGLISCIVIQIQSKVSAIQIDDSKIADVELPANMSKAREKYNQILYYLPSSYHCDISPEAKLRGISVVNQ
jgi:hypothetical protein